MQTLSPTLAVQLTDKLIKTADAGEMWRQFVDWIGTRQGQATMGGGALGAGVGGLSGLLMGGGKGALMGGLLGGAGGAGLGYYGSGEQSVPLAAGRAPHAMAGVAGRAPMADATPQSMMERLTSGWSRGAPQSEVRPHELRDLMGNSLQDDALAEAPSMGGNMMDFYRIATKTRNAYDDVPRALLQGNNDARRAWGGSIGDARRSLAESRDFVTGIPGAIGDAAANAGSEYYDDVYNAGDSAADAIGNKAQSVLNFMSSLGRGPQQ